MTFCFNKQIFCIIFIIYLYIERYFVKQYGKLTFNMKNKTSIYCSIVQPTSHSKIILNKLVSLQRISDIKYGFRK